MSYNENRGDLDFLNPHEIEGESEPTKCDLFNDCENVPDEAINYVDELENELKELKKCIPILKEVQDIIMRNDLAKSKIELVIKKLKG